MHGSNPPSEHKMLCQEEAYTSAEGANYGPCVGCGLDNRLCDLLADAGSDGCCAHCQHLPVDAPPSADEAMASIDTWRGGL